MVFKVGLRTIPIGLGYIHGYTKPKYRSKT